MSSVTSTELQDFALFIQAKLAAGETKLSPEEVLYEWRDEHPNEEEFEEEVRAIQEALDEVNAGVRGVTVDQLQQEFDEMRRNRDRQS